MAAFVHKSKNIESSLNLNNLLANKYPIIMFDLTKWLIAIVFAYFFKDLILKIEYIMTVKNLFCELAWLDQI